MTKKPIKATPARKKLDARALVRPGTQIVCAMADFDAADGYQLRIDEMGEVMRVAYAFCDEEDEDGFDLEAELDETLAVTAGALVDGEEVLFLSQGSTHPEEQTDGPYTRCTPPFLVSRKFLAAVKAGQASRLRIHGESAELENDGNETVMIKVNGEERDVGVVRARSDDPEILVRVLDDETLPLLMSVEFQGDNYIRLMAIYTRA